MLAFRLWLDSFERRNLSTTTTIIVIVVVIVGMDFPYFLLSCFVLLSCSMSKVIFCCIDPCNS